MTLTLADLELGSANTEFEPSSFSGVCGINGVQFIFQDPPSSLNPKMTVRNAIAEPLRYLTDEPPTKQRETVMELLERVGLSPAELFYSRYPHHLSGGQRQRVVVARAVSIDPEYFLADEPVAIVDVSVRAQIMELL